MFVIFFPPPSWVPPGEEVCSPLHPPPILFLFMVSFVFQIVSLFFLLLFSPFYLQIHYFSCPSSAYALALHHHRPSLLQLTSSTTVHAHHAPLLSSFGPRIISMTFPLLPHQISIVGTFFWFIEIFSYCCNFCFGVQKFPSSSYARMVLLFVGSDPTILSVYFLLWFSYSVSAVGVVMTDLL